MRERMAATGKAYRDTAARVNRCVDGMVAYLEGSKEAAAKVVSWGTRLSEAMETYVRKAEDAKQDFHQKSRSARMAHKILDEAERQGVCDTEGTCVRVCCCDCGCGSCCCCCCLT